MRIFIGIKPEDKSLERIDKFLKPIKKISSPIKWVKPKNIHLSLKFIGEVSEKKYSQIEDALINADLNVNTFNLKIIGCGKFGKNKNLNIFWTGIENSSKLKDLFYRIENVLEKIDIKRESREFKPHITLGRNKKQFNFKFLYNIIENNIDLFISELRINKFQIFKSELSSIGPTYTILKEISIGKA